MKQSQDRYSAGIRLHGRLYAVEEASALAIKECNLRNFQAASDIYHLILSQFPDYAVGYNNLGIVFQKMDRPSDALASYDKVITLNPDFAEAYNNRGIILQKMERYDDALADYSKAITLKPGYVDAWQNRGITFQKMQRYEESLASFDKAISLKPDYANAYNSRGITLQKMNRYDEALASFDKAITLKPDYGDACHNLGVTLVHTGDMQGAEKMFLKALALKPDSAPAIFSLANIRKYRDAGHADIKTVQTLLHKPAVSPADKEYLYFTLGKMYDDCGLYDEAFECFRQANRIGNAAVSYNPDAVAKRADATIDVFSKDFLEKAPSFASDSSSPLFIVGMPRSGTTLLAGILSNHRSIATAGELPTMIGFTSRLPELTGTGIPYPQAARHITPAIATRLIHDYEHRLRHNVAADLPYIIDKHPMNFWNLGLIAMLFPKAQIIHCTRHPLDSGISNYFQRFSSGYEYSFDLRNIGHFYNEYAKTMAHWQKVLPMNMLEVSYEDMVVNTEQMVRQALDFLRLEWDERCLIPHTNPCAVETASNWQVRQPIYRDSVERWRHYEKHLQPLKEVLQLGTLKRSKFKAGE